MTRPLLALCALVVVGCSSEPEPEIVYWKFEVRDSDSSGWHVVNDPADTVFVDSCQVRVDSVTVWRPRGTSDQFAIVFLDNGLTAGVPIRFRAWNGDSLTHRIGARSGWWAIYNQCDFPEGVCIHAKGQVSIIGCRITSPIDGYGITMKEPTP